MRQPAEPRHRSLAHGGLTQEPRRYVPPNAAPPPPSSIAANPRHPRRSSDELHSPCAAHHPPASETSLATSQSHPLRRRFSAACAEIVRLGRKTHDKPRAIRRGRGKVRQDIGVGDGRAPAPPPRHLFDFPRLRRRDPPIRHRRDKDGDLGRQSRPAGGQHLLGRLDTDHRTPGGSGIATGPLTSVTRAPRSARAAAMAWPCRPLLRLAI